MGAMHGIQGKKPHASSMKRPRPVLRLVFTVVSHPRITLALTSALTAACILLAIARLAISADQNKLFSSKVQFFHDFIEFEKRFPENQAVYILIEPRDAKSAPPPLERWTAAAEAVAAKLRTVTTYVQSVDQRIRPEDLGRQGILFDEPARLKQNVEDARRFIPLIKTTAEKPGLLTQALGPTPLDRLLNALTLQPADAESASFIQLIARSIVDSLHAGKALAPDLESLGQTDPGLLGYYYIPDESDPQRQRRMLLIRVRPMQNYSSLTAISEAIEAIRAAVNQSAKSFPEFTVGVTGRPALEADEMRTTDNDSRKAEIAALSAVFIGMVLLLRSWWLALAAELALGVGIAWTFGWATLAAGELNLLSIVFFLALIGIGMDYLVQILSRYRREALRPGRDPGRDARKIWIAVFRQVGPPVTTACLGAAGAFLVSLLTDFEGAASLGLIAGGGLILCLIAGYTFLPALLTVLPIRRGLTTKRAEEKERVEGRGLRVASSSSLPSTLHPLPSSLPPPLPSSLPPSPPSTLNPLPSFPPLLGPAVWITLLFIGFLIAPRAGFDPNLLDLQADNLESVKLVRKLQTWNAVVLSKDLAALRSARDAIQNRPTVASTESVLTAYDNLAYLSASAKLAKVDWAAPPPIAPQDLKRLTAAAGRLAAHYESARTKSPETRAAAASLRELESILKSPDSQATDSNKSATTLSAWQQSFIGRLRHLLAQFNFSSPSPSPAPSPIDLAALPADMRSHYISDDGYYALYIYPKEDLWNHESLMRFIEDIEPRISASTPDASKGGGILTGIAHNIHHSTAYIKKSFYHAAGYALALIVLLVLIDMRHVGHTLAAISVLGLGLPMLILLMGLLKVDWNFANFFGLPILIGAGHEYGVFMMHRYRESIRKPDKSRRARAWPAWDVADSALLLCAFVTSASFGFFAILAHHRGLKSLGLVMALGSACIYLATVIVLRPILKWRLSRRVNNLGDRDG